MITTWSPSSTGADALTIADFITAVAPPVAPVIQTTNADIPSSEVGEVYSFTFHASGSFNVWSVGSPSLPYWLHLSSSGVLTGTPPTRGDVTFQVVVTNGVGSDQATFTLRVPDIRFNPVVVKAYGPQIGPDPAASSHMSITHHAQNAGVIVHNGNLYCILIRLNVSTYGRLDSQGFPDPYPPPGYGIGLMQAIIYAHKSTDGGATWTVMDEANSPIQYWELEDTNSSPLYDGVSRLTVALWNRNTQYAGNLTIDRTMALNFQDFNMDTDLWEAPYGISGAPLVSSSYHLLRRPDGSLVCFHNRYIDGSFLLQGLTIEIFDPNSNTWTTGINVDTNLNFEGPNWRGGQPLAVIADSAGRIHVFMFLSDSISIGEPYYRGFYQQILPDNTLGPFVFYDVQDITSRTFPSVTIGFGNSSPTNPVILGDKIIIPMLNHTTCEYPTLLIGTPLSSPVFTEMPSPGMDPSCDTSAFNSERIELACDGVTLAAFYQSNPLGNQPYFLRVCRTKNLTDPTQGWESFEIYSSQAGG